MKKINIAIFLFGFLVFSYTHSIAANQVMTKITDSSQMNLEKINSISSVVEEGGVLIGTIVSWPHGFYNPINKEKCTTSSTNTSLPRCKWLKCDGSTVDPILYPEYTAIAMETPSFLYDMPYGTVNGEYDEIKAPLKLEIDIAVNEGQLKGRDDGLIGLTVAFEGFRDDSYGTGDTFTLTRSWTGLGEVMTSVAYNVIYYIRAAN